MSDEWQVMWDARMAAMERVLGPSDDKVFHALIPFGLMEDAPADVVSFSEYINGKTYVTSDLIGCEDQKPNSHGNYELMICSREESDWAADIIGKLAAYTCEAVLNPGETMDIGPVVPDDSKIAAFVFCLPDVSQQTFDVNGIQSSLLLCIGITSDELELAQDKGSDELLNLLREHAVFPYTDLTRQSVLK